MEITMDLETAEISVLKVLNRGKYAEIFLVLVDSVKCVMKVYHDNREPGPLKTGIVSNLFDKENNAYQRLRQHGLCDKGIIPQYFGFLKRVDPRRKCFGEYLHGFLNDRNLPNATFIEYIPNLKMLDLDTYTEARMAGFIHGIQLIHAAHVLHGDTKPRNMMVVTDPVERVIWMDFDRAKVYDGDKLSAKEQEWFNDEMELVVELGPTLAEDKKKGYIDSSRYYFYT